MSIVRRLLPYFCPTCGKGFRSRSQCDRHRRRAHPQFTRTARHRAAPSEAA